MNKKEIDLAIIGLLCEVHRRKLVNVNTAALNRYGRYLPPYNKPMSTATLNKLAIETALKDCAGQRSNRNVRLAERKITDFPYNLYSL